jgi:hypothetical protein
MISIVVMNMLATEKLLSHKIEPSSEEIFGLVDAFVIISFGELSKDTLADYSIAALRKVGKWRGKVYLITDKPDCFSETAKKHSVNTIKAPQPKDIMDVKSTKTKLFSYLPEDVSSIVYLDADVLVTQSLRGFFRDLSVMHPDAVRGRSTVSSTGDAVFDMGLFYDARGHFVGFCSGCEKWHTGVLWLRRGYGTECLQEWDSILRSGRYSTDQESIDEAERSGKCKGLVALPGKHLLFAKDYIAMLFRYGHTFTHLTAAARIETQDYFYSSVVVPLIKSSLRSEVGNSVVVDKKSLVCS